MQCNVAEKHSSLSASVFGESYDPNAPQEPVEKVKYGTLLECTQSSESQ